MTEDEFRLEARGYLQEEDQADAFENFKVGASEGKRLLRAQSVWPDMTLGEMWEIDRERAKTGKRGRPPESAQIRAAQPIWQAARDVDRLKILWSEANPNTPMRAELALEIAAARHGVSVQALADSIRRPASRRIDRLAARK